MNTPKNIDDILNKLSNVKSIGTKEWQSDCPCQGHNTPQKHLSITDTDDKALVKCFGTHTYEDICQTLGYDSLSYNTNKPETPKRIDHIYQYIKNDKVVFECVKYQPKDFRQRRPDGNGGYIWNLKDTELFLYHYDDIIRAVNNEETICIPEGEKDTDALWDIGFVATTNPLGADKDGKKWLDSYTDTLKTAKNVIILADKDDVGLKFAYHKARMIKPFVSIVKVVVFPDAKDVSDWLTMGHNDEELRELIVKTPEWEDKPIEIPTTPHPDDYIITTKTGQTLDFVKLATEIFNSNHFLTVRGGERDETVYIYRNGVYSPDGEGYIKKECEKRMGIHPLITRNKLSEITEHFKRSTFCTRDILNSDVNIINIRNGLLNLQTRELKPHTPEFHSTVQIPVKYDNSKDCPHIKKFLSEIHNPEDIPIIQEFFGYCLYTEYPVQKAFLQYGMGANGKTVEQELLKTLIGKSNCSNISWQSLEDERFARSSLEGKLVNMFDDLQSRGIESTGNFKMLTGSGTIGAEKKFKDNYSFVNFAKLIFSTNKPPRVSNEDSYAFWRRWVIISYPNQFTDELGNRDPNLIKKLTTDDELSGLLNYALDGLQRLLKNSKFSYSKTAEETQDEYLKASDPVYAFITDKCEIDVQAEIAIETLYDAYRIYSEESGMPVLRPMSFGRLVLNQIQFHIKKNRVMTNGVRNNIYQGIKLNEDTKY